MSNFEQFPIVVGNKAKLDKFVTMLKNGERILLINDSAKDNEGIFFMTKGDGTMKELVSDKIGEATLNAINDIMSEIGKLNQKIDGFNSIKQINLQDIQSPYNVEIKDFDTKDFKVSKINILKHETLNKDTLITLCDFDMNDEHYVKDDRIVFENGKAKINTVYFANFTPTGEENEFSADLDLNYYNNITNLEDIGDKIKITNIPSNVELRQQTDFIINDEVGHIQNIKINGAGDVKLIFSFDSGKTWNTINKDTKEIVSVSYLEIAEKGISINDFNNLDVDYDFLLNNKRIRFNYCLNNSNDSIAEIDNIKMSYDGFGVWKEYQNYDLMYLNNKAIINIKDPGTYKINY